MKKPVRVLFTILCIVFIGIFAYSGYKIYQTVFAAGGYYQSNKNAKEVQNTYVKPAAATAAPVAAPSAPQATAVPEEKEDEKTKKIKKKTAVSEAMDWLRTICIGVLAGVLGDLERVQHVQGQARGTFHGALCFLCRASLRVAGPPLDTGTNCSCQCSLCGYQSLFLPFRLCLDTSHPLL